MERLEVLLSCMGQNDLSIVEKSHLTGDVLIINQCQENADIIKHDENQCIRMISTTERGLSNSRNMAIKYAVGDICLLCDDDERFLPSYEDIILNTFKNLPEADIIAFNVKGHEPRLRQRIQKVGFLKSLRLSSCHLAFRRRSIFEAGVWFDPLMGAGSGNGGGEENKFLIDCLKKKLRIYYVPAEIAVLCPSTSSWFFGYDKIFFKQRGVSTKYMLGMPFAILYGFYYLLAKHSIYCRNISLWSAAGSLFYGIFFLSLKEK